MQVNPVGAAGPERFSRKLQLKHAHRPRKAAEVDEPSVS